MSNKGHIILPRHIMETDIWRERDSVFKTYAYLIMKANHKTVNRGRYTYNRGEVYTTYENMQQELGMSSKTIAKNLKTLKEKGYINIVSMINNATRIKINNYSNYQPQNLPTQRKKFPQAMEKSKE